MNFSFLSIYTQLRIIKSMTLDYLDFEIEIGELIDQKYQVTVLNSPAGNAYSTVQRFFDELVLENRLKELQIALLSSGRVRRRVLTSAEEVVQRFGIELFELLFTGEVRNRYDISQERARYQNKGLRIKLRIHPPLLANLPWEFLHDPRTSEYICLSRHTPLVRYLELPQSIRPLVVKPPLRILGMIASPTDLQPLDVQMEQQQIEKSLAPLRDNGTVELHWLDGQNWQALQKAMRREQWHIFHFVGHGDFDPLRDEGLIALCNTDGKSHHLTASHLGELLGDNRMLRLAVLNACFGAQGSKRDLFSSTAATLIRHGLPAVVAMQQAITDDAAIEFTRTFYESLTDGLPVDAAISEARKAIRIAAVNTLEWGTPVLYSRSSDGRLFDIAGYEGRQQVDNLSKPLPDRSHRRNSDSKTIQEQAQDSLKINIGITEDDPTPDNCDYSSSAMVEQLVDKPVAQRFVDFWKQSFLPSVRKQYGVRMEAALRGVRDAVVLHNRVILAFGANEFARNMIAEVETNDKLVTLLSKFLEHTVKLECQLGEQVCLGTPNDVELLVQYSMATLEPKSQNQTPSLRFGNYWREFFLPSVRKEYGVRVEAALRGVGDIAISQDCVAFAFGHNDFTRELIAEPEINGKLAALLSKILGRSVRLECQQGERAYLIDPLVQYAVSALGAKVVKQTTM